MIENEYKDLGFSTTVYCKEEGSFNAISLSQLEKRYPDVDIDICWGSLNHKNPVRADILRVRSLDPSVLLDMKEFINSSKSFKVSVQLSKKECYTDFIIMEKVK